MTSVVVTMKIMPESPDSDLHKIETESTKIVEEFGGKVGKVDITPIAFGLKSVNLMFVIDEKKGSTDNMEAKIATVAHVNSVEVTDVRRTLG